MGLLNILKTRVMSSPVWPFSQLMEEDGTLSEEKFVNDVNDAYGSKHVQLRDKAGVTLDDYLKALGKADDAIVAAGAVGSLSAKLRRVTQGLADIATAITGLLTGVVLAAGSAIIGRVGHDKTGIGHGVTTVTTAGTDVVLAASTAAKVVIIQAQTDNTGAIAVGDSGVDATVATGTGVLLYAGDSITLEIDNLNDVYIDATVNGEGVRYTYLT